MQKNIKLPFHVPTFKTIGHRGAGKLAAENTLQSFKLAKKLGLTWVEFDTQPCETGEWILLHDESLDRTTNGQGLIANTPFGKLQLFRTGKEFFKNSDNNSENLVNSLEAEPIPLLSQALETLAALNLQPNIEIKSSLPLSDKFLENFLKIVEQHWPSSKPPPLISSFQADILFEIKDRASQFPLGYNIEEVQANTFDLFTKGKFFSLHCDYEKLTPEILQNLLDEPFPLLLYTVNEPKLAQEYFQKGVWAIFSDFPNLMIS